MSALVFINVETFLVEINGAETNQPDETNLARGHGRSQTRLLMDTHGGNGNTLPRFLFQHLG